MLGASRICSHPGNGLRFVDLDLAAAGHAPVGVVPGQVQGGVEVGGLDEGVADHLSGARSDAVPGDPHAAASGAPKPIIPSPTFPAQALHSPMTASICSGVGGAASAGVMGAW